MIPAPRDPYPIDYDTVRKGDVFPPEWVRSRVGGLPHGTTAYELAALKLKETMRRELWARGKHFTLCFRKGSLCVLNDDDASCYNEAGFETGIRRMGRSHAQMAAVDAAAVADARRPAHEHALGLQGLVLAAVHQTRRRVAREAHQPPNAVLPPPAAPA